MHPATTATELAPGRSCMISGMGDHDGHTGANLAPRPVREADLPVLQALTWDPATAGEFAQFGAIYGLIRADLPS